MVHDPILDEIHAIREALSRASGDESRRIAEAAKERHTASGRKAVRLPRRKTKVELGEWLNEDETAAATSTERAQAGMLAVVGPQRPNSTKHVGHVWLNRKPGAKVRPADADQFSRQLYACIEACDSDDGLWRSPAGHFVSSDELGAYPPLARYLQRLTLHRRRTGEDRIDREGYSGR